MKEFDAGCFIVELSKIEKIKRDREQDAAGETNVAVMFKSAPLEGLGFRKKSKQCRYFNIKEWDTNKADEINESAKESFNKKSNVFTDDSTSYFNISKYVKLHITKKTSEETTKDTLKWGHIIISNVKQNPSDNYNDVKGKYLQLYLNEIVYKLNRRCFGDRLFESLVIASIT